MSAQASTTASKPNIPVTAIMTMMASRGGIGRLHVSFHCVKARAAANRLTVLWSTTVGCASPIVGA
jgi:hypothetical protein